MIKCVGGGVVEAFNSCNFVQLILERNDVQIFGRAKICDFSACGIINGPNGKIFIFYLSNMNFNDTI